MAHYCVKPEVEKCSWLYKGTTVGTNKKLCNCYSPTKPCELNDESTGILQQNVKFPESGDIVLQDFIDFFGESREDLLKIVREAKGGENDIKKVIFKDASTSTRSEINAMYTDTEYYKIILNYFNADYFTKLKSDCFNLSKNYIVKLCMSIFKNPSEIKVLDYGCGPGFYGIFLALNGYDVTMADLPHKAFDFMKFTAKKYGVPLKFQDCTQEYSDLTGKFDYIICSDVLEHVDEPEQLLEQLISMLNDEGVMFLSTFFDDMNGEDPSHLRKNTEKYGHYQTWLGRVMQKGIIPAFKDDAGVEKGYLKREYIEKLAKEDKNVA